MIKELTANEVKAKMIDLHRELTNFNFYLGHNRNIDSGVVKEAEEAIIYIQEILEREVKRIGTIVQTANLDNIVRTSLEQAGFKPDVPPASDSK
jgi:hypothetical protein